MSRRRFGGLLIVATLVLLLTFAGGCIASLLRVHNELLVAGFLIPFEACEVWLVDLIVCLQSQLALLDIMGLCAGTYPLLVLLVDCI
jgi:hypothetical protein